MHFWSFWAKYCHFLHILSNSRPKTNLNKVPRWVFRYVGNKTFDFSSKKKGFFAQKRPNLAQNLHFWSIWARPCRLIQCPVGGSVGGCGARAVSRKTPIYFIIITILHVHQVFLFFYCLLCAAQVASRDLVSDSDFNVFAVTKVSGFQDGKI